jgi:hypothetical protein
MPADLVLECPAITATNATGVAVAVDACGSATVTYSDVASNSCAATKVIKRTWTAVDASGNSTNAIQTIVVRDSTPPSLIMPADITLQSPANTSTNATGAAMAQDGCGAATVSYSDLTSNYTGGQVIQRTWSAIDTCGNQTNAIQVIRVQDPLPLITAQPQCQPSLSGNSANLCVTASGVGPLTYQWCFNGAPIPGATGTQLSLTNLTFADAGLYNVIVSNPGGSTSSAPSIVNIAPQLSAEKVLQGIRLSWPAPFILQAAGNPAGPYSDVTGATSPYTPGSSGPMKFFRLRSPDFTLSTTRSPGGSSSMNVSGAPGWNFIIQASTNSVDWVNVFTNTAPCTFTDTNASQVPNRTYRLVLTAGSGTAMAAVSAPIIASATPRQIIGNGGGTVLNAEVTGTGPLTYQWRFNGVDIAGATGSTLALGNLQFTNGGIYSVAVSNIGGIVNSSPMVVDVAPRLLCQPNGHSLNLSWPAPFVLQSAPTPAGPFTDLPGAVSPFTQTASGSMKFFRIRGPNEDLTLTKLSNGNVSLGVTGSPGWNYTIQYTSNFVTWVNLVTTTAPATFVDTNPAPVKMYRMIWTP